MTECRRFRIEGKVQGVWFRESTRQQAYLRGIRGYARNCPDGSVEVLAAGSPEAISALRAWLHQGPPMAEVSHVQEWTAEDSGLEEFVTG
jgi:acylphosphatase